MAIVDGVAYRQPFETAMSAVLLEDDGVRLDSLQIVKAGGRAAGAAYVGYDGTYSFNLDGRGIPIEGIAMASTTTAPSFSGRFDFNAGGSGTFDRP